MKREIRWEWMKREEQQRNENGTMCGTEATIAPD